jgi:NAD(P)-dependent dehydrogenase (short-subunit alcohol dehydrogenase family)
MSILENQVAIVTGGGRGLGASISISLAKAGCNIAIATKDIDQNLFETVNSIKVTGKECIWVETDVSDPAQTQDMAKKVYDKFRKIDILVNNAAVYFGLQRKKFHEISPREWDLVMSVNVKGTWLSSCAVFPYMKENNSGRIINIASEVFFTGSHGFPHYVASKGAVIGLTRALAAELGPFNICVNAVAPGFLDTEASRTIADVERYDTSKTPLRRIGTPQDIAGLVVFLCTEEAGFITGQTIVVDGGRYMH